MPQATYQQTDFIGGEWTKSAQGRSDEPRYKSAMRLMRNAMPSEQGAYTRRSGTLGIIPTRNRQYARLMAMESTSALPYVMEFTDGSLRFIFGTSPVFTNDPQFVSAVVTQTGGNLILTTAAAHGWAAGDDVMMWFPVNYSITNEAGFRGRVLQVVATAQGSTTGGSTLCLGDEVGQPTLPDPSLGGPTFATDGTPLLFRIQRLDSTGISGDTVLRLLRFIPTVNSGFVVQGTIPPKKVAITTTASPPADPVFSISTAVFLDGPYGATKPDTGTVSAFTGTPTFTPASSTFTANDVGRPIRLFSEPPAWASGTTYAYGALVKYNNAYWQSTQGSNTGVFPGTPSLVGSVLTTFWAAAPNAQRWVWGTITSQSGSSCVVTLGADLSQPNGVPVGATNVIPSGNGNIITQWQVGLWSAADGYPICGVFHEGRLFFSGPVGNRLDISTSADAMTFSPTDQYGNVNDNSAISYILNQDDTLVWMHGDDRGVIAGGLKGEWLISAATDTEAMTATSVKARRVTKHKSAQIEPVFAGSSVVFAQRYKRHIYEYLVDSFSGRFGGKAINDFAPNFTEPQVAELAYTDEPTPIIWCRMADGSLAAATYRRVSRFITEAPVFNAWHGHVIGDTRTVEALCGIADSGGGDTACQQLLDPTAAIPDTTGAGDRVYLVTNAPALSARAPSDRLIEVMQPMFTDADPFAAGWFVDSGPGRGKHIVAANVGGTQVYCSPTGGLRGQDGQSGGTESADLGLRALGTPSTTFPNAAGNTTRNSYLAGFADSNVSYFNGCSALSGLPRPSASNTNFMLSVWLNLTSDNIDHIGANVIPSASATHGQGFILGAQPILGVGQTTTYAKLPATYSFEVETADVGAFNLLSGRTVVLHGPAYRTDGTQWLAPGATTYAKMQLHTDFVGVSRTQQPFYRTWQFRPSVPDVPQGTTWSTSLGIASPDIPIGYLPEDSTAWTGNAYTSNPGALKNNGWFHLMISIRFVSQGVHNTPPTSSTFSLAHLQVYVNDTAYFDGSTMSLGLSGGVAGPYTEPADLVMSQLSNWLIGGRMPGNLQSCIPGASGLGLIGAMTELYVNTSDAIDLSSSVTRGKFQASSVDGLIYAPVDLGLHGALPTGNKPLIYCTGGPSVFHLNRAKKNAAFVVHNDLPDTAHILANTFGDPILLDNFAGPVMT